MPRHPRAKRLLRAGIATLIVVSVVTLGVRLWSATTSPGDATDLTAEQQIAAVFGTNQLEDWPTDTPGMLPLDQMSSTAFLAAVTENEPEQVHISADGEVAAYLASDTGPIAVTLLVTGQDTQVANTVAAYGGDVNVVDGVTSRAARVEVNRATSHSAPAFFLVFLIATFIMMSLFIFTRIVRIRRAARGQGFDQGIGGGTGVLGGRRAAAKAAAAGKVSEIPKTRFTDVAGADEAVEDLLEIVEFLRNREKFAAVGATPPAGAVLVGPPGTGKTLLARAVAGEAGVPFFAVAGSDFVEKYVGVGAGRVRTLFKQARASENGAIIFIDEIDAVGRARGGNHSHPETENTLNALLVEMDGFKESNIIVLAATNRHDMLDKALTRPGRLDREVQVPLPDRRGREAILQVHAKDRPLADDIDFTLIARRTPGMSGAELERVVNEACLVAVRDDRDTVTNDDFDQAVATASMGRARVSAVVTEHDREITAWHEAGHTVCAMLQPDADPPVSVSIIPRGPAGGVTWMAQGDDQFLTRKRAHARLVVALGGRAAEEILLDGEYTSGAYGDLTSASNLAFAMVTQYGMTDHGLMVRDQGILGASTGTTDAAVHKVEDMLAESRQQARDLLTANYDLLQAISLELLDKDNLNAGELDEIRARVEQARAL